MASAVVAEGAVKERDESTSPGGTLWRRFKRNRLGYWSLVVFGTLYAISLAGEIISNDRPLVVRYHHNWYFPLFKRYPESTFGGQLPIKADYNDPFIPTTHKQREHDLKMKSVPLTPATLKKYDIVLISTDHTQYDYDMVVKHAKVVVDSRNATKGVKSGRDKIWKA